jgi:hypothetical protein
VTAGADDDDPPNRPTVLTFAPVGDPVHADDMAPLVGAGTSRERRVAMVVAVVGVIAGIVVVSNANSSARRPPPQADGVPTIQAPGRARTPPGALKEATATSRPHPLTVAAVGQCVTPPRLAALVGVGLVVQRRSSLPSARPVTASGAYLP